MTCRYWTFHSCIVIPKNKKNLSDPIIICKCIGMEISKIVQCILNFDSPFPSTPKKKILETNCKVKKYPEKIL